MLEGIVIVNKPKGITSHDVVDRVRAKFKMRRVGHAGTLDPLATGVLVILLGRATKQFSDFEACDKAYEATLILGTKTNTADIQGKVIENKPYDHITKDMFLEVLKTFEGEIEQQPPMFSAVKVKGKRLYQLARRGIAVERPTRTVSIQKLQLLHFSPPEVKFSVQCSKGMYVRQLAEDIGEKLGSSACITQIERSKVGPYDIACAVSLEELQERHVLPASSLKAA